MTYQHSAQSHGGRGGNSTLPEEPAAAAPRAPVLARPASRCCCCFLRPPSARCPGRRPEGELGQGMRTAEQRSKGTKKGFSSAASLHSQKSSSTWQGKGLLKPTEVSQHPSWHRSSEKSYPRSYGGVSSVQRGVGREDPWSAGWRPGRRWEGVGKAGSSTRLSSRWQPATPSIERGGSGVAAGP